MNESLAWLRDPETGPALSHLLCGLITDIRLILVHPDLGNAAKLGAITRAVDQLAPPPGPDDGTVRAAAAVAAMLARGTGTATALFERLAGEQICIELSGRADRPLTAGEAYQLRAAPGTLGHQRTGTLRAVRSGLVAAEVTSLIVPTRLPAAARQALGIPGADNPAPPLSDIPLGTALADLGVRREPVGARFTGDGTGMAGGLAWVESSARMWLDDAPVALASERVPASFCLRARRAAAA